MTEQDIVATLVDLSESRNSTEVRVDAVRALAAHLNDRRTITALKALTSARDSVEVRMEAIRVLGQRR